MLKKTYKGIKLPKLNDRSTFWLSSEGLTVIIQANGLMTSDYITAMHCGRSYLDTIKLTIDLYANLTFIGYI